MRRGSGQPAEEEQEEELTVESLLRQSSEVMHHVDAAKKRMSDHSIDNEQLDNETKEGWVRKRSQDLVGQGMSAEAADRFAAAADQHTALMQAAQQRGADSGEYLRPLPIPAAMLPRPPADDDNGNEEPPPMERSESSAQAHVGMRKKASLWSKLRKKRRATGAAATGAKRAPEAGLHLRLFATAVAGARQRTRCAIVTLELFEVSPIFSSAGASVCAKLRTISSEEGASSSEPVLLSKSGAFCGRATTSARSLWRTSTPATWNFKSATPSQRMRLSWAVRGCRCGSARRKRGGQNRRSLAPGPCPSAGGRRHNARLFARRRAE